MASYEQIGESPPSPHSALLQMISRLTNQLHDLQTHQVQAQENYQTQIRQLHEGLNALRQNQHTPLSSFHRTPSEFPLPESPPIGPMSIPVPGYTKRKATLPDPPKFDGTRKAFRAWLLEMRNKLRVDGQVIGTPADQFAYIFSRLEKTPQNMTIAFVERGGTGGSSDPGQYLEYLDSCYGDPNAASRAIDRLQILSQGVNESFAAFLPKFEKELADGGGSDWADSAKISWLKGSLNDEMKRALIGTTPIPTQYTEYARLLQTVGSQMDGFAYGQKRARYSRRSPSPNSTRGKPKPVTQAATTSEEMDWEATRVNRAFQKDNEKLQGKRAKWVTREEMTSRRKEKRCMRCGRTGCKMTVCPLLPAQRPETKAHRARPVLDAAVEQEEDEAHTDPSDQTDYESSKE